MGAGPNYVVIPHDWANLEHIIADLTTRFVNENTAFTDFLLKDGTRELTADWDAGSFKITAEQFQSDIATSTAPLVVASTTVVTNFNADLLDGQHGSFYAPVGTAVTAALALTDNKIVRGDVASLAVQTSGIGIDDSDNVTGVTSLTITTTGEINFRDTDISIGSTLFDGILDMSADISIDMFYDNADVGDGVDGQSLNISRRAGEGDDYIRLYVDKDRKGLIGFSGDDDLLQLLANALTVNGTVDCGAITSTGNGTITTSSGIPLALTQDSTSAAVPVITFKQDDTDEAVFNVIGFVSAMDASGTITTLGVGGDSSANAVAGPLISSWTHSHMIQLEVNGTTIFFPGYTFIGH